MARRLLDAGELERSSIVANCTMNRLRPLASYARELGFSPLDVLPREGPASWLDLCCGSGRALIEAADVVAASGDADRVRVTGIDLVGHFDPVPAAHSSRLRLIETSALSWTGDGPYDLITCVHGLHYVGDKLGLLERIASWLVPGGRFTGHLDLDNLRDASGDPAPRRMASALRRAGFEVDVRHHRISLRSGFRRARAIELPFRYLGADDHAGPNVTGQPAVHSHYEVTG